MDELVNELKFDIDVSDALDQTMQDVAQEGKKLKSAKALLIQINEPYRKAIKGRKIYGYLKEKIQMS